VVLSEGYRRIRLDVDEGSLAGNGPVALQYRLHGLVSAEAEILPLRRFVHLCGDTASPARCLRPIRRAHAM
jgi:hypothetical protein